MPRYRLVIEYDGSGYVGWQRQAMGRSVQQAIEDAIIKFAGEHPRVQCSGRTDAGVHAIGQTAHVFLSKEWRTDTVRDAINAYLKIWGDRIAVVSVHGALPEFDARFSALKRNYTYRILNRRAPGALEYARTWHVARKLDADAMHAAAQTILGTHDFTTFRASECQATGPVRTLDQLDVERRGDEIHIHTSARSFLHHQVRSMAGSLEQVGCGRWRISELRSVLEARDRKRCGPMAPAHGLYFASVDYPEALLSPPD